MDDIFLFLLLFTTSLLLWLGLRPKPWRLPPGPFAWPLIGNAYLIQPKQGDPQGAKRILALSKKYGDIIHIRLGIKHCLVLNKFKDIKEAYSAEELTFKDQTLFNRVILPGIGGANGARWREQRRFVLTTFRELGMGKKRIENVIQEELGYVYEKIDSYGKEAVDFGAFSKSIASNIISCLVFGHRFVYDDAKHQEILQKIEEVLTDAGAILVGQSFPYAEHLPGDLFHIKKLKSKCQHLLDGIIREEYEVHAKKFNLEKTAEDYIEAFLKQIKFHQSDEKEHWFTEEQLFKSILDLFISGTDTSAITLRWAMLAMANYPCIQEKVRQELHSVVGCDQLPSMKDKLQLPYTEATVLEILRKFNIVEILSQHCSPDVPVKFKDFILPPNTVIMTNLWAANNDPTYWQDPDLFNPDRFIDHEGKVRNHKQFLPFSIGKRVCLGESLARMEIFLFFCGIMQKYRVAPVPGNAAPSMEPLIGKGLTIPRPHRLVFIRH